MKLLRPALLICFGILLSACGGSSGEEGTPGPASGRYIVATSYGGLDVFDTETLSWQYPAGQGLAPLPAGEPAPGQDVLVAGLPGDFVLIAGGTDPAPEPTGEALSRSLLYDRALNTWQSLPALPDARSRATATALTDGRVLIAGGAVFAPGTFSSPAASAAVVDNLLFDLALPGYVATGPMMQHRRSHAAIRLDNGQVLVSGGIADLFMLDSAELYDPDSGSFSATGSMSVARFGHRKLLLADGRVFVIGNGFSLPEPLLHQHAELWDQASGLFAETAPLLVPRTEPALALLPDGRVLIAGGGPDDSGGFDRSAEIYDPASNSYTAAAMMNIGRRAAVAATLPDGRVLVFGRAGAVSAESEIYDPAADSWSILDGQPAELPGGALVRLPLP